MGHTNQKSNRKNNKQTVEVLYQKLGNRWFAFSYVDGEMFVGSLTQDEINAIPEEEFQLAPENFKNHIPKNC